MIKVYRIPGSSGDWIELHGIKGKIHVGSTARPIPNEWVSVWLEDLEEAVAVLRAQTNEEADRSE